jgi:hypothetical protein
MRPIQFKILVIICLIVFLVIGVPISLGLPVNKIGMISRVSPVTPLTPLYYVKLLRERAQSFFVFGDEDSAYFKYTLASKRLSEATFLRSVGLDQMVSRQKESARRLITEADRHTEKVRDKVDVQYLRQMKSDNEQLIQAL